LREKFPITEEELERQASYKERRATWNPDAATVRKNFDDVRAEFDRSKLREELQMLIHSMQLPSQRKCNKIVCFGAGTICPAFEPTHHYSKTFRNKHAALLAIRDALKADRASNGEEIEIFLQDSYYTRLDLEVLKEYGMTIVNGDTGSHMGFLLVDEGTLVVDFDLPYSVFPLFMEITTPIAFLRDFPITMTDYRNYEIYEYTLPHKGKTFNVPALGT
jgi:hypothetical protein